jgi:hypothetical protein
MLSRAAKCADGLCYSGNVVSPDGYAQRIKPLQVILKKYINKLMQQDEVPIQALNRRLYIERTAVCFLRFWLSGRLDLSVGHTLTLLTLPRGRSHSLSVLIARSPAVSLAMRSITATRAHTTTINTLQTAKPYSDLTGNPSVDRLPMFHDRPLAVLFGVFDPLAVL